MKVFATHFFVLRVGVVTPSLGLNSHKLSYTRDAWTCRPTKYLKTKYNLTSCVHERKN